jgi:hypothetical protein
MWSARSMRPFWALLLSSPNAFEAGAQASFPHADGFLWMVLGSCPVEIALQSFWWRGWAKCLFLRAAWPSSSSATHGLGCLHSHVAFITVWGPHCGSPACSQACLSQWALHLCYSGLINPPSEHSIQIWPSRSGEHHSEVSQVQKAKAARFLSYVEFRPNTNTAILWKTGHAKRRSHTREGRWTQEVKKVNMVDELSIQEQIQNF